ncbi:MAG: hypothetical protein J6X87_03300 [Clostridia bacterium]|nr:hypothetical protein [Clostridia bacterium]
MKKFVKPAVFVLILCVVASLFCTRSATPLPANAISLQEQSWLSHLRPTSIPGPRGRDSYPAELLVSVSNQKEIKLKGTCSLEGKLTDEDILDAIKKAASEAGYKSPENAVDDKLKIDSLKSKLSFTPEEQERIIKNWLALVGMDKVADLLQGQLPSYGGSDAVTTVVGMISSGQLPGASTLSPVPTSVSGFAQGMVVNGVFLTVDQFKRDQEKYKNIVELSEANARFREFSARLNSIVRDETRKKTAWTIRIQDQVVETQLYRGAPDINAPYIYTSDIVLKKNDGNFDSPAGTYQGSFELKVDVSLEDHDRNFAKLLAEYYNNKLKETMGNVPASMYWTVVSQTVNRPSVNETTLSGGNVYVTLDRSGSLGGVFELKLNTMALDVTRNRVLHDYVSVLQQKGEAATETLTWTDITDSETGTAYHQDHSIVVTINGETFESTNTDDDPYPNIDVRGYIGLTLVVDMAE